MPILSSRWPHTTTFHVRFFRIVSRGFLFILLTTLFYVSNAQQVFFNHITQENGLRNGNVRAVVKDHQGFVWIGTEDGLHRYDGYTMKIYRNQENDSTTVSGNFILCLFEDSEKTLWIGTLDGSLCAYDRQRDKFIRFGKQFSKSNDAVRSIYESKDKKLYIGSSGLSQGVISRDLQSITFNNIPLPVKPGDENSIRVPSIVENLDGNLLISVNNYGLFNYYPDSKTFSTHDINGIEKNIQCTYVDKKRKLLWFGTWKNGLFIFDPLTKKQIHITEGKGAQHLRSNFIPDITSDGVNNIWIASDHGLSFIPNHCNPFEDIIIKTYLPDTRNQTSIHGSALKSVYVDNEDRLWVGTVYEGLNVYDRNAMNFGSFSISTEMLHSSIFSNINALEEDRNGNLWIGLDGDGLFKVSGSLDEPKRVDKISSCTGITKIKSLKLDKNNNLWIGTWDNGVLILNIASGECTNFSKRQPGIDIGKEVISLTTDAKGRVWIGTFDNGLFRYTPQSNELTSIKCNQKSSNLINRINALLPDDDGLWIGRETGGLSFLATDSISYTPVDEGYLTSSSTISAIHKDINGMLWLGVSNQGLIAYHPKNKTSIRYGEDQGLANSMIYAIEEDSLGRLWLSSNVGISSFEKETGKFFNYNKTNGLSANQFNRGSSVKLRDGNFAFGNIRGLNYFMPSSNGIRQVNPTIAFTRFVLGSIEQSPGITGSVLTENIIIHPHIQLQHNQNSISIEFVALNFDFTHHTQYSYKLEGLDTAWQYGNTRRLVSYTNLKPGNYTLAVRAAKPGNNWSSANSMSITISPAFWQTGFFKISMVFILLGIVLLLHRFRVQFLLTQRQKLEALVQERTAKLKIVNQQLNLRIEEINTINSLLQQKQDEVIEKNNEILAQNEELHAQNEHIADQHDRLLGAQAELKEINANLENIVNERTEKLQHTIDDLNKTVFELDRFVYSASHDLSAPLKSILGLIGVIHLEQDPTKAMLYINYIRDTVIKLENVIKSMVDYAQNAHVIVQTGNFNLHELIEEVITEYAFLPESQKIIFDNRIPDGFEINSDRTRLKVVISNLIGNGIKYMDKTKEVNLIKIDFENHGKYMKLSVSDNGIGISKEYQDKVFNMYFRATEASKGSGLGLFIAKETMNKIGGSIQLQSEIGVQTIFELTIPVKK